MRSLRLSYKKAVATATAFVYHEFTAVYQLGFMYLMDNGVSPYLSYSESFSPVPGTNAFGDAFVPTEGQQWEAGVKFQPQGTEHLLTASVYQITD